MSDNGSSGAGDGAEPEGTSGTGSAEPAVGEPSGDAPGTDTATGGPISESGIGFGFQGSFDGGSRGGEGDRAILPEQTIPMPDATLQLAPRRYGIGTFGGNSAASGETLSRDEEVDAIVRGWSR